jgi:hypothetical protein
MSEPVPNLDRYGSINALSLSLCECRNIFVLNRYVERTFENVVSTEQSSGILLFMVLYGFSVFLETPKQQRERRARYIVISFVIMILGGLDSVWCLTRLGYLTNFPSDVGEKFPRSDHGEYGDMGS